MPVTIVNDWQFAPEGDVEAGLAAAADYVEELKAESPGCLLSLWLADRDNPRRFFHAAVFESLEAARAERESPATKRFVERLFPHIRWDETFTAPECDVILCGGGALAPLALARR